MGITNTASAQDAPIDFARLHTLTRPGDTVYITDAAGRGTTWMLGDVPLELLLQRAGDPDPK
jgi:hypothetical protein